MKLVEYIESPSDNELFDNDNMSMASSSIYTSPEKSIMFKRINDGYEKNDEKSMASAYSMKSFAMYNRRVFPSGRSSTVKDDVSLQLSEFIENERYNMVDIERQLDDISLGMSHASLWYPSIEKRCYDVDMLHEEDRQHPDVMNSCMYHAPTTDHNDDMTVCQSTKWKLSKRSLYACFSCVLGAVVIIFLLAALIPSSDENKSVSMGQSSYIASRDESDVVSSTQPSVDTLSNDAPTQTPTTTEKYLHQPTIVPTYLLDDDECVDDNETIFSIGNDHRDCAWLALHEASQVIFCQAIYPYVYNVCKLTCHSCNILSSAHGAGKNTPSVVPTAVETIGPSSQSTINTIQQQPSTSSNNTGQGAILCLDDIDATIDVGQHEGMNCTWLASHPASQIIFCRSDYFPLVYETCRATCKNCE